MYINEISKDPFEVQQYFNVHKAIQDKKGPLNTP